MKHGGTEEHSCIVLVCIWCRVPWGELYQQKRGKVIIIRPIKKKITTKVFQFLILKRYPPRVQVLPGLVLSPLPPALPLTGEHLGLGPFPGRDRSRGNPWAPADATAPTDHRSPAWNATGGLVAHAPSLLPRIHWGGRGRTGFCLPNTCQGKKKKEKNKKNFLREKLLTDKWCLLFQRSSPPFPASQGALARMATCSFATGTAPSHPRLPACQAATAAFCMI